MGNDTGLVSDDDDVPVNQMTSFHGVLNKYVHVSGPGTRTASASFSDSTPEPKRQLDTTTDLDSHSYTRTISKRRRGAQSQPQTPILSTTTTMGKTTSNSTAGRRITRSQSRSTPPAIASPSLTAPSPKPEPGSPSPSISPSAIASTLPSTPSPSKRSRNRGRSTPRRTTSSPSSLPASTSLLRDTIPPNLTLLLVGVNPGIMTGTTGFAYAHPSNLFWKLLHSSGITSVRHPPSDTYRLPELYNVGNTNIVERPTRDASMLSKAEMDAGVPVLEAKVAAKRPAAVCLVGKSIWEAVWRARKGRTIRKEEFRYGWQNEEENMGRSEKWEGAPVFVATTTSGLAAGMSYPEKQAIWNELGRWVVSKRACSHGQTQVQVKTEAEAEVQAQPSGPTLMP
ncbi:uracil-DNA glycosylase-like protein [Aspergillus desertorum]